jgi:hypothetical protein
MCWFSCIISWYHKPFNEQGKVFDKITGLIGNHFNSCGNLRMF